MERLLAPDFGLTIWTIVSFAVLVFVLGRVAWKPLLQSLNEREEGIRRSIQEAQSANATAQSLKTQFEKELADAQSKAQQLIAQAQSESQKLRDKLLKETQDEAAKLTESTKKQLAAEKEQLMRDVRKEVATLSTQIAEKLMKQTINAQVQESVLSDFYKGLEKTGKN